MIKVLIVDDLVQKREKVKRLILDNVDLNESDVDVASCIKDARRLLYGRDFDLMVLDLLVPVEDGGSIDSKNSIGFLGEVLINPSIRPPIHILGLTGYQDEIEENSDEFKRRLWNLIYYSEDSAEWEDLLKNVIFHLVKARKKFFEASIKLQYSNVVSHLDKLKLPSVSLGINWLDVSHNLSKVVERILSVPNQFSNGSKAKNVNASNLIIKSEYDFQNLIHLVVRPWIPSMEPENIAITFDGNTKNADFSIKRNSLIIEAKYIDSTGKKNDVLKTLKGLQSFYSGNSNVKALLFLILVENDVEIDIPKVEEEFSFQNLDMPIVVKVFRNLLT